MKNKKLVIYGIGETADIMYEYFTHDSEYEVVAFTVDKEYKSTDVHYNLPVVEFDQIESLYPSEDVEIFAAATYDRLNRSRAKMFKAVKNKGYKCANYISSRAFVWHNVELGENVCIFENNVVQHMVKIGNNVMLWSGNHIGHRSVIHDHVYISSHVVISGFCEIGSFSFLGVNSTFNDRIRIGQDTIVGSGALIVKSFDDGKLLIGSPAKPGPVSSYVAFNVDEKDIQI